MSALTIHDEVRLALIFSDVSMSVLPPGATLDQAKKDREWTDKGERNPERLTKIARVTVTVTEIVETPVTAARMETCPHCGKPLGKAPQ